jgi:hypothetical protein
MLAWYNVGPAEESSFGLLKFKRRSPSEDRYPSTLDLIRLFENWPGGCPPLMQDAEGRLAYLHNCLEVVGLLAPQRRSRLQAAVARAWENSLVRRGKQVFISYSHLTAQPAQIIADGLRRRGIGVALDVHELAGDAQEWDVETWIAENILACDVVVYIVSASFVASGWINRETE